MEATVIRVIPKKIKSTVDLETGNIIRKRVAAYARVSTDLLDQKNSFNAQLSEYSERISKNPDWEFVKLYSDECISGTSTNKRKGFNEMINDAKAGLIDLILVKSISRFARNTVDCVQTVRELRAVGVEVWFDKEAISTNDPKVNLMLTMFASFAEEESRSISENVKWGVRKRMAKGERKMPTATTLGYVTDSNGKVIVDESERELIKRIFNLYLFGNTLRDIAQTLRSEEIKKGTGSTEWEINDVRRVLTDEKYTGMFIMQKTVVVDFLDHKAYKNDGLEEKYILDNHHEAIISKARFDLVQTLMKKRFLIEKGGKPTTNILCGLMFCESCLREMKLIKTHPGKTYERHCFTCKTTSKLADNYKICKCADTLDYKLVVEAISLVFKNVIKVKDIDTDILEKAYFDSLISIQETINRYKEENMTLQEKLTNIISASSKLNDLETYKIQYDQCVKKIEYNKSQILLLEKDVYSSFKQNEKLRAILSYSNDNLLTYHFIKDYIGGVIRKKDNSIRIILSDNKIDINETTINSLLRKAAIYTDVISIGDRILHFDVIKEGGSYEY